MKPTSGFVHGIQVEYSLAYLKAKRIMLLDAKQDLIAMLNSITIYQSLTLCVSANGLTLFVRTSLPSL